MFKIITMVLIVLISYNTAQANQFENLLVQWVDSYHFKITPNDKKRIVKSAIKYSTYHGVNPILTLAILNVESSFRLNAVSPTGPKCLMQVATSVHKDKIRGRDIFELNTCMDVGVAIIKECGRNNRNIDATLRCYSGYKGNSLLVYQQTVKARYDDFRYLARLAIKNKHT